MNADGTSTIESSIKSLSNYLDDDLRQIIFEEEKQYAALKNQLIEIQLGAKEALPLLLQTLEA